MTVVANFTCDCGCEEAEIVQGKRGLYKRCPVCSVRDQSEHGQNKLKKMVADFQAAQQAKADAAAATEVSEQPTGDGDVSEVPVTENTPPPHSGNDAFRLFRRKSV